MDAQLDLFTPTTLARKSDPASSHMAAEQHTTSGKASRHRDMVLAVLQQHAGKELTAGEIAKLVPWGEPFNPYRHANEARRRLPDLKKLGLAVNSGDRCRQCSVLGTKTMTWSMAPSGGKST